MNEIERELRIRVSFYGAYLNTDVIHAYFDDLTEENEMELMMAEVREYMENEYGDTEAWDEGEVSWVLDEWEDI